MNARALPMVAIGDLVEAVQTWNPTTKPDDTFHYIDLSAVSQAEKHILAPTVALGADAPSRARQLIQEGDVLVSTVRPNLNGVAPVTEDFDGATASTGFCVLRPRPQYLASPYLMQWVRSPQFVDRMVRHATGASYPAVSDKIIKASAIPLPPLDEQRRIAAILDKADALRRKRKRIAELIRSVPQSLFTKIFGDPQANPGRWNRTSVLSDVADIGSGITKGRKKPLAPIRPVPYLAVANVQDRSLDLSAVKTIEASEEEISRFRLKTGDLVLTEGGDPDKLGRGTVWRDELPEAIHQNHIFRVRIDPSELDPVYLNFLVGSEYGKSYFLLSAKQTTGIASINKSQLSRFPVLLPPLDLQKRFALEIDRLAAAQHCAETGDKGMLNLFSSLQHRAFSGKL